MNYVASLYLGHRHKNTLEKEEEEGNNMKRVIFSGGKSNELNPPGSNEGVMKLER